MAALFLGAQRRDLGPETLTSSCDFDVSSAASSPSCSSPARPRCGSVELQLGARPPRRPAGAASAAAPADQRERLRRCPRAGAGPIVSCSANSRRSSASPSATGSLHADAGSSRPSSACVVCPGARRGGHGPRAPSNGCSRARALVCAADMVLEQRRTLLRPASHVPRARVAVGRRGFRADVRRLELIEDFRYWSWSTPRRSSAAGRVLGHALGVPLLLHAGRRDRDGSRPPADGRPDRALLLDTGKLGLVGTADDPRPARSRRGARSR